SIKTCLHVVELSNCYSDLSHLAFCVRIICVISYLSWQVKGHAQSCLSSLKKIFESLICLVRSTKSSVLSHCPKSVAIHPWVNTSCEWWFSRLLVFASWLDFGIVESLHRNVRVCLNFVHKITLTTLISSLQRQRDQAPL